MCLESEEPGIYSIKYRTFEERLTTFNKKWTGKLKPEILANSGFYYINHRDICQCFYCGIEIFQWVSNDCPIEEHHKYSPKCDLNECLWNCCKKSKKSVEEKKCNNDVLITCFAILFICMMYETFKKVFILN